MLWVSRIFFTYLIHISNQILLLIRLKYYHKLVYVLLEGGRRREEL